ncbi:glycosyltransferase family 2 protein [Sulfitobacter donghicola]|uniref:Glycosyl transferase family 2 n=1 Tax=Sulfitobacter donghicola DSW-25 = KCTC 12864 = JCM 14565 TaxID=1300350 RepID=A0A073IVP4_9RHOB|nr:glycosyltransferase family 2 protein [Sulfitobacter donghicola]KEJ89442.1 glycosyl transferase family 2 [Sulfitobacter donghicola DSW-25 = KCTC 12864 = JCM 14565]KIN69262.1 Glycosyl transferase family 2 [Sulfitobacter donghicola DSW-25 = KCTC 12864 = JCM 14565]
MTKWGIVATIKADTAAILRFAAYHIELGAHRIYIYLDAPNPEAQEALRNHPKTRVVRCDEGYWKRLNGDRPDMHQPRQTLNATRAYKRARDEVDWLIHMDVDEFLVADTPIAETLAALPDGTQCARARPMELLAGCDPQVEAAFKTFVPANGKREQVVSALYPTYGEHLKGGFLSHIAGKLFVRTGIEGLKFRIHNAFVKGETNPNHVELPDLHLAHFHALDWDTWYSHFEYRLNEGSYRADLGPARSRERGGITMHELFNMLYDEDGKAGLKAFFQEVCADTPELRARLNAQNHLLCTSFPFDTAVAKNFPEFTNI